MSLKRSGPVALGPRPLDLLKLNLFELDMG